MTKQGRTERRRKQKQKTAEKAAGIGPPPASTQAVLTVAWSVASLMTMILVAASLAFVAYRLIRVENAGAMPEALSALGAVVLFAGACTGSLSLGLYSAVRYRRAVQAPLAFTIASITASLLALALLALAMYLR